MNLSLDKDRPRLALVAVPDPTMHRMCRDTLVHAGFELTDSVTTGAVAVAAARERRPTVILLSHQLDDVPAEEAIKWLRSNRESATTPIIIVGGKTGSLGTPAGVTALPRPVSAAQLRNALAQTFGAEARTSQGAP